MSPFHDAYVLVPGARLAASLARFVERYVAAEQPREPRLPAVLRTYVEAAPADGDAAALEDLRRDPQARTAFSIYLRAKGHAGAIVTVTEETDLVLGLSLDDPDDSPQVRARSEHLVHALMAEFDAVGGVTGLELPPPQSSAEWDEALLDPAVYVARPA